MLFPLLLTPFHPCFLLLYLLISTSESCSDITPLGCLLRPRMEQVLVLAPQHPRSPWQQPQSRLGNTPFTAEQLQSTDFSIPALHTAGTETDIQEGPTKCLMNRRKKTIGSRKIHFCFTLTQCLAPNNRSINYVMVLDRIRDLSWGGGSLFTRPWMPPAHKPPPCRHASY